MEGKICKLCLKNKPLSSYHNYRFAKDKKDTICKKCKSNKDKEYKQFKGVM